jgi:hypothetical protein
MTSAGFSRSMHNPVAIARRTGSGTKEKAGARPASRVAANGTDAS